MQILVDEEYGFRHWLWTPNQESAEELMEHWKSMEPKFEDFSVMHDARVLGGNWKEMEYEPWLDLFDSGNHDGVAHVHEYEDSWIRIGDDEFSFDCDRIMLDPDEFEDTMGE